MISIIVATDKNFLIGNGSELPWSFPEDLLYFKKMTMGKFVLMGQNTFSSIKSSLKGRSMIVLSQDKAFSPKNVTVARSIKEALSIAEGEIMVAGGRSIYEQFLNIADRIYLTSIDDEFKGDVYFPQFKRDDWIVVEEKKGNHPALTFLVLERCN